MFNRTDKSIAIFCLVVGIGSASPVLAQEAQGEASGTYFDFEKTLLEGKMKAPTSFFLQGKKSQSLSNMVKLRANFRKELKRAKWQAMEIVR